MFAIWNRRADLTGVNILATYVPVKPLTFKVGEVLTGFFPDIFYILQESLNFTYKFIPRAPGGFGRRQVRPTI